MYKFRYTIKASLEQIKLVQDFLNEKVMNLSHKQYKEYCNNELIYTIDTDTYVHKCTRLDIISFRVVDDFILETEAILVEIPLHLFPGIEEYDLVRSIEVSSGMFGSEYIQLKSTIEDSVGLSPTNVYYNVIVESRYKMPKIIETIRKLISSA